MIFAIVPFLCTCILQDQPAATTIEFRDAVAVSSGGRGGRSPIRPDPVAFGVISGKWVAPKADDHLEIDGKPGPGWKSIKAGDDGTLRSPLLRGGYASANVSSEADQVMILEASGHDMVYVNNEPRTGDPYSLGYLHLPVSLRKGENAFLFSVGRGSLKARLVAPRAAAFLDLADVTLPEPVAEKEIATWAGVVVVNASNTTSGGLKIIARLGDRQTETIVPPIPPLSTRKVGVKLAGVGPKIGMPLGLALQLTREAVTLDEAKINLTVRTPEDTRNVTFVSEIDGSVQYYGYVPAKPDLAHPDRKPSLLLSLHGASVEGGGQARVYSPKVGMHIVAPTNRRPYGFDWEDWGRLDAIEVLNLAETQLATDPHRTYLSGHSMGGHGTWHLGVTYPGRFTAIAPSAGWVSMFSYAGLRKSENATPIEEILQRCSNGSDTVALSPNLAKLGVYILHGDADDNVPVGQAREMRKALSTFHPDFAYFEKAGAGHWWGNECCDWPPLIDFLARHENPTEVRKVDFLTASPGISATRDWVTIEAQSRSMMPSSVHLDFDPTKKALTGTTQNVGRLSFRSEIPTNSTIKLDGSDLTLTKNTVDKTPIVLTKDDDKWKLAENPSDGVKTPARCGPFKAVFHNRMMFVYGTKGTPEENAWALSKARYDAETFGYRGNGSIDVIPDTDFKPDSEPDRNVILYGNADSHASWGSLLGSSPVQIRRGRIDVGDHKIEGDDLGCLFVQPRPGSKTASVGVVSGTGPVGMRTTDRLPYFSSGVAYPDLFVIGSDAWKTGLGGVRCAGFFGGGWNLEGSEIIWRP